MIRFPQVFYSPDDAGGAGDAGAGTDGPDAQTHWLDTDPEYASLAKNDDARATLGKYKTRADQAKGHVELQRQFRQSFRVPDVLDGLTEPEVAKITDRLKGILKPEHLRRISGAPDSPDGYKLTLPDGYRIHDEMMAKYRQWCHRTGKTTEQAQEGLNLLAERDTAVKKEFDELVERMTNENYATFRDVDCKGDKELTAIRLENMRRFLQSHCRKADGTPDPEGWEKFASHIYYNDRIIELPLLRALNEAAQMKMGTGGGSSSTGGPGGAAGPQKIDVNQRWPKSAGVMT